MIDLLATVEIFRGIPREGLIYLAGTGIQRTFATGDILLRQGAVTETMYVILSGRVEATNIYTPFRNRMTLARMGAGDVVGATGLLDHEPPPATVIAAEPTQALELDDLALAQIILRYPAECSYLLEILSRRLGTVDELAQEIEERNGHQRSA